MVWALCQRICPVPPLNDTSTHYLWKSPPLQGHKIFLGTRGGHWYSEVSCLSNWYFILQLPLVSQVFCYLFILWKTHRRIFKEMMSESVDKLKEELGKLVHSLKLSAFNGVREQAQSLIHKDRLVFFLENWNETKSLNGTLEKWLFPLFEGLSFVFRQEKHSIICLIHILFLWAESGRRTVPSIGQYWDGLVRPAVWIQYWTLQKQWIREVMKPKASKISK